LGFALVSGVLAEYSVNAQFVILGDFGVCGRVAPFVGGVSMLEELLFEEDKESYYSIDRPDTCRTFCLQLLVPDCFPKYSWIELWNGALKTHLRLQTWSVVVNQE
jgi:hypothetical protein